MISFYPLSFQNVENSVVPLVPKPIHRKKWYTLKEYNLCRKKVGIVCNPRLHLGKVAFWHTESREMCSSGIYFCLIFSGYRFTLDFMRVYAFFHFRYHFGTTSLVPFFPRFHAGLGLRYQRYHFFSNLF